MRAKARWNPQPKQEEALCRPEFEIGFGGARGGGKTDTLIAWLGYDSEQSRLRGALIRKNSVDLQDAILRIREIHPQVKIYGNPPIIKFPGPDGRISRNRATGELMGGATYFTGHLKDKNALSKWVGQNLQRVGVEELNLVPSEDQYRALLASVRSTIPGVAAQIFSTFNPDNVGHTWLKKRFHLKGIPQRPIITEDDRSGRMRIFIPARVEDNQVLLQNDPGYVQTLEGLGDGLREQWRWGSWDDPIIKGAYYTGELAKMRRNKQIRSLPFHPELSVHTWWDIGNDTTAIWFVQFVDGWVNFVDFYQNDSLGFPFYLAKLQEWRESKGYNYGIHHFPHDFDKMEWGSGRERKEVLEEQNIDYEIVPRPQSQQAKIDATRLLLARSRIDKRNCAQGIDALINYRKDWVEQLQTFRDQPVHDWASHPADAIAYVALSNLDSLVPEKTQELPTSRLKKAKRDGYDGASLPKRQPSAEFRRTGQQGDVPTPGRFNY